MPSEALVKFNADYLKQGPAADHVVIWDYEYNVDPGTRNPDYPERIYCPLSRNYRWYFYFWYTITAPVVSITGRMKKSDGTIIKEITHTTPADNTLIEMSSGVGVVGHANAGDYVYMEIDVSGIGVSDILQMHGRLCSDGAADPYMRQSIA